MKEILEALIANQVRPLDERSWRTVNRNYVARSLAELLHERMVTADVVLLSGDEHELTIQGDDPAVRWTCTGHRRALDFWHIEPGSVARTVGGQPQAVEAVQLFIDLQKTIGSPPFTLAHFIEETMQTLYSDACILARGRPRAAELVDAGHQGIERAMEGHPWVLVNKGRIGFSAMDLHSLTPEMGADQRLIWLAAHREHAGFHGMQGVDHDGFLAAQLGPELTGTFRARLDALTRSAHDYVFIPVNEWQWQNKIAVQFAGDIATGRLIPLGVTSDRYLPQQSIRTFVNASDPTKCYVKTALSVLNTFQIRGLDPRKLRLAPLVTEWLQSRLAQDPELQSLGLIVLGEVASVAYEHPAYRQVDGGPYQYREMLGALWRESPLPHLAPGETLATMASMLYVDNDQKAFVQALAERSGLSLEVWLERYLHAYLTPLLHCFFHHETYFVAHGENTILVLRDGAPTRVILKDLVEEVQVSRRLWQELPKQFQELFYHLDEPLIPLFILTDVFDAFFRYLADILATYCGFAESTFWRLVAKTVQAYQDAHSELASEFDRWDLFCAEFPRFCLNKYRLVYHGYAEVALNVHDLSPKFSGTLHNPLHAYRAPRRPAPR